MAHISVLTPLKSLHPTILALGSQKVPTHHTLNLQVFTLTSVQVQNILLSPPPTTSPFKLHKFINTLYIKNNEIRENF